MGKGWNNFSIGNRLSEGDACVFEFHNYTKGNTLNVRITKKSDFEKHGYSLIKTKRRIKYLGPEVKLLPGSKIDCLTAPAENRAIQSTDAFKSKYPTCNLTKAIQAANAYPSCEVIMRPSYLRKGCVGPPLPAQFAKPFLTKQSQIVTLRVSDGRMWDVKCTTSSFPHYQAHLLKGWYDFVLGNHLKEGGVCVFELVDMDNLEMNVTIFRVNSTS
ncbi:B3 domain-containing protein REM19-like [Papaver somniferum]|uniref:B3 domain-containing protein REM19-like n=1 Tax=Papaver somniferum TaxID=3469 RepID=UPI000E6FE260|nr:B3 domain-containing protein REM19-like [Papaver somniferum]